MRHPLLVFFSLHEGKQHEFATSEDRLGSPAAEHIVVVTYFEHEALHRVLGKFFRPGLTGWIPFHDRMHIDKLLLLFRISVNSPTQRYPKWIFSISLPYPMHVTCHRLHWLLLCCVDGEKDTVVYIEQFCLEGVKILC